MFKNILANYVGKIWGLISVFVFVPFYIKILGIESYAVINFYTVILTLMYFADAGLSATLNREIARTSDKRYIGNLLFTIERIYLVICLFIAVVIFLFSGVIATYWLKSEVIPLGSLSLYISLMGGSVAFQLFTTLENSGLMGLEKQVLSNGIQVLSSFFRSAVVLLPLYFFPTLFTYFVWQLLVTAAFFFITRYNLWKFIRTDISYQFDVKILKTVGRFAIGMMLMAVISSLNTQIDKILVSKMLSLKEFGYYSLAGIMSQAPVIIITPIALAILPRMTRFSEEKNLYALKKIFHHYSVIISSIATAAALVLFLYTKDLIFIWTGNSIIASSIDHVAKVLILGSVFLAFQYMPYHLAIANGHTKLNVRLGIILILFIIPALIFFVHSYGLIGATFPWLFMNILGCFYLGYFLIRKFLPDNLKNWVLNDTLLPLVVNVLIGIGAYYLTLHLPKGYLVLLYSVAIGILSLVLNIYLYNRINPESRIKFSEIIGNGKI